MNAKEILVKAVQCDTEGRILEAQCLYQDGIEILMALVNEEPDVAKKHLYGERIKEYINRAEQIKLRVQRHATQGEVVAHIPIDDNSTGNSYKNLFGRYLKDDIREVLIEEPYLVENYHFRNLIAFLELLLKSSKKLTFIKLVTKTGNQSNTLNQIKQDLLRRGVTLGIRYEDNLHDRKIVLSSGFIIKIGRGLHFYKAVNPTFSLGLHDYDYRKCMQTDVDIWRTQNL